MVHGLQIIHENRVNRFRQVRPWGSPKAIDTYESLWMSLSLVQIVLRLKLLRHFPHTIKGLYWTFQWLEVEDINTVLYSEWDHSFMMCFTSLEDF